VLRDAVARAKLGRDEQLGALRRLDDQTRLCEAAAADRPWPVLPALFSKLVAAERAASPRLGGRTVFDDRRRPRQLSLFAPANKTA
jgi:hypothetical protein